MKTDSSLKEGFKEQIKDAIVLVEGISQIYQKQDQRVGGKDDFLERAIAERECAPIKKKSELEDREKEFNEGQLKMTGKKLYICRCPI